ncbi:MAG TPA: ABC transporter permease [Vicinamibacterales bacterium]|nr:ABC transporter permease [Vicinamibacterales bacterium]
MIDAWRHDVRFALRLLRKSPLFTATAALSLAIGIGANSTIFSVASAMLLRPMPGLAQPDRLVDIGRAGRGGATFDTVSYPNYSDIRDRVTTLSGVYAQQLEPTPMSLGGNGDAERVYGALVSSNYFSILGTTPHLGRLLRPQDVDTPGGTPETIISHDLWTRRFASDPAVVGRPVAINGYPFTVVGVASPRFQGTTLLAADLWIPLSMLTQAMPDRRAALFTSRGATWLFMGGRLKEGATLTQANAELASIGAALQQEHPRTNATMTFRAAPIAVVPGLTRMLAGFIGILMVIVTLLLLIACVNLAGMLLARGASRTREIAVRLAIGAGPGRIARQLLTETAVLFVLGGVAGLVLSRWLTSLLLSVLPQLPVPLSIEITTDWRVVAFTIAMSIVAAVLCGLAPAIQARRTSLIASLKSDSLDGRSSRLRLRNVFVVGQVTMSLVLVIAAGLFLRALEHAASAPTGFDQRNVEVVSLDLALGRLDAETGRAFARDLLERTRALPAVTRAAVAVDLPLDGGRMGFGALRIPGAPGGSQEGGVPADWNVVEPGFFHTLGVRLVRGRDFDARDTVAAPAVAIVNEAFARFAWPGADPIGRQMETDTSEGVRRVTIVGVADDARFMSVAEPAEPYVYVPLAQVYQGRINLLVKTGGPSAIPEVRALVRAMNPNLPVTEALPLADITALGTIPQRIAAAIAGTLGLVGLLLAAIGIYGVTSYAVSRRTREIGIRVALGADSRDVMRLMLKQGAVLAGIGIVIGLCLAAAGAQVIRSLLFGVSGVDPMTFGGASAIFTVVALVATYLPARRALSVDPMAALRNE